MNKSRCKQTIDGPSVWSGHLFRWPKQISRSRSVGFSSDTSSLWLYYSILCANSTPNPLALFLPSARFESAEKCLISMFFSETFYIQDYHTQLSCLNILRSLHYEHSK